MIGIIRFPTCRHYLLDLVTRDIELMEECIDSTSVVQDVSDTPSYTVGQCIICTTASEEKLPVISTEVALN